MAKKKSSNGGCAPPSIRLILARTQKAVSGASVLQASPLAAKNIAHHPLTPASGSSTDRPQLVGRSAWTCMPVPWTEIMSPLPGSFEQYVVSCGNSALEMQWNGGGPWGAARVRDGNKLELIATNLERLPMPLNLPASLENMTRVAPPELDRGQHSPTRPHRFSSRQRRILR